MHTTSICCTNIIRTAAFIAATGCALVITAGPASAAPFAQECAPGDFQATQADGSPGMCFKPGFLGIEAPHDAVKMSFRRNGLTEVATFQNTSQTSGQCHYDAQDVLGLLPGKTDDFAISANGSVSRTYPAPPPLSTYHATVTCHGDFGGQDVEFGSTSQDVSG
jgi:hypothetical protein